MVTKTFTVSLGSNFALFMSAYFLCQLTSAGRMLKKKKKSEAKFFQRIRCYIVAKNEERNDNLQKRQKRKCEFRKKKFVHNFLLQSENKFKQNFNIIQKIKMTLLLLIIWLCP